MAKSTGLGKGLDALFGNVQVPVEEEKRDGEVVEQIPITSIEPNKEQARKKFDLEKLEELSNSIKEYGIIQPIIVTKKGDYYEIYVEVDSDVIDNDADSMYMFDKDNSASGVHIAKCNITYQIWKCGLPKAYVIDETWSGKIKVYSGEANAKTECKYSYTDKDCNDDSKTEAIWRAL